MASTSSSHQQNAFSGIEPPNKRRKVEESSRLFDVFINHRGPDVKHTLATQLYNSLEQRGIRVFLDSQEKELGTSFPSTIETAIRSASIHIAIFSKRYAESAWCLAELVLMLQSKAKIIPLFYQVEPRELRYIEKGVYGGAFYNYEQKGRYIEKINEWKEALRLVSFTAGYEFNVSDSSDLNEIVSAVEKEVQRTKPLHVAEHPVGLHKLVTDFERQCLHDLVQDFENECRMNKAGKEKSNVVSIFGMGGVGKTTLSKELFNQKRSQYRSASFLFDVREAAARSALPSLQSMLIKDLFCEDHRFQSLEEGTNCLRNRLERSSSLSFLIVLDDIDHVEQLHALIPMDILNKYVDNLVIITTRDVGVLVAASIEIGYQMKGFDRADGKELFCWHAFGQSHPCSGYEDLVEKFVNTSGGLPLSLIVLGRHVVHKDPRYWSEELKKVSKTLPKDVKKRLRISFDSLDHEEQQIFMDVACFFIDKSKTTAMNIWERSGWNSHHALETLKDKCLLEEVEIRHWHFLNWKSMQEKFAFRMHDHLRDLGREMANELRHPPRVWHSRHLKSLELKGFQNILAQTKGRCFHSIWDESMGCQITYFIGEPEDCSDNSLLWLQLDYPRRPQLVYPRRPQLDSNSTINPSIPSWIPLQNLQCLRINGGCFQILWQSEVQAPSHLKELKICGTSLKEFPDLSGKSETLRFLEITDCKNLKRLSLTPDLSNLIELKIEECTNLERVLGISDATKLTWLCIKECPELDELPSLRGVSCLEEIEIDSCEKLKNITLPTTLTSLSVRRCRGLQRVAVTGDLTKLTRLIIHECPVLEELPSLCKVSCMKEIEIDSSEKLKNITLPTTLTSLSVQRCRGLQRVAVTGDLTKLTRLIIHECPEFEQLPSLCKVSCLERVEIDSSEKLKNITLPTTLTSLSVRRCRGLQRVAVTGDLTKLTRLIIHECPVLEELPSLCKVSCMKEIEIDSSEKLKNITLPTTLTSLSVRRCRRLQRVAVTGDLTKLTRLIIHECPVLEELPSLCKVSCMKEIEIDSSEKLKNITLPTTLTSLSVRRCRGLQRVAVTGDLTKLTRLIIDECPVLEELPSLCKVSCMEEIEIDSSEKLKNITLPTTLTILTQFIIEDCPELEEFPSLCRESCLIRVAINFCEKLQNIPELHASRSIKLFYCGNAVIRNSIHKSKTLPRRMDMIGRAVDGAVSSLNKNLFCDANIDVDGVIEIGTLDGTYYPNWSKLRAVIICLLVVVDGSTSVEGINRSLSPYTGYSLDYQVNMTVREGEWIITMVACNEWHFIGYHREIENILRMHGIIKKGFRVEVKNDEDCKKVLLTIVDRLYSS